MEPCTDMAEIGLGVVTTVGLVGGLVGSIASNTNGKVSIWDGWTRFFNFYYTYFPEDHNYMIDNLLMNPNYGFVSNRNIQANGTIVPGIGKHIYYINGKKEKIYKRKSLWIEKIILTENNRDTVRYRVKYFFAKTFIHIERLKNNIKSFQSSLGIDSITVVCIDTSSDTPKIFLTNKIYYQPRNNQILARNQIIEKWGQVNNYNLKVLIHGPRGIGKTYMGLILKKYIDMENNINVRVFDDFNPSSVGVNIKSMALSTACKTSPVIIVINEIDIIYKKVIEPTETFDARLQHSRNKSEFHNMLDSIGLTPYVIAIFTTEKTYEELYQVEEYRSFMRPGRVDMILNMTKDNSFASKNVGE